MRALGKLIWTAEKALFHVPLDKDDTEEANALLTIGSCAFLVFVEFGGEGGLGGWNQSCKMGGSQEP